MLSRLLCLSILLIVSCTLAADDSFKNFRIPDHHVSSLTGDADIYGMFSKSEQYDVTIRREFSGNLGGSYYWLSDSDRLRNYFNASLQLYGYFDYRRDEKSPNEWQKNRYNNLDQQINASWGTRVYPWESPFGCSANLSGSISTSEIWELNESSGLSFSQDSTIVSSDGHSKRSWNGGASTNLTIGYGRVRDATAVFDVYTLEERLIETGALSGELKPETRREIAAIFYARSDYENRYEREDKYFWQEVEAVLKNDPAFLPDHFDAYSVHRIAESIDGNRLLRQQGFFVGPTLYAYHSHQYRRSNPNSAEHSINEQMRDRVRWGIQGEYYSALSRHWQLDIFGEIEWERKPLDDGYNLDIGATATYIIADRWRYIAELDYYRHSSRPSDSQENYFSDAWRVGLSNSIRYYIEDSISLEGKVEQNVRRGYGGNSDYSSVSSNSETRFSIGVNYLFFGVQSSPKSLTRVRTRRNVGTEISKPGPGTKY